MKPEKNKKTKNVLEFIIKAVVIPVVVAMSIIFAIKLAGINYIQISGESMANTYHNGNFLVMKKSPLKADNIIIFKPHSSWDKEKNKEYIKRIVAVAGDTVAVTKGEVVVNGKVKRTIASDYTPAGLTAKERKVGTFKVPKGKLFVMGDNYKHSNDSLFEFSIGNDNFFADEANIFSSGKQLFKL